MSESQNANKRNHDHPFNHGKTLLNVFHDKAPCMN